MLQKKNEGAKKKTKLDSSGDSYQPPQAPSNASKQQPKVEPAKLGDDKMQSSDTETENQDSIYLAAPVDLIIKEMQLEEDERDEILVSWENARHTGHLDEYVNSEPMV